MRALILNSGMGKRMGDLTSEQPKCMTEVDEKDTILSRQLKMLYQCGIRDIIMTTGLFDKALENYCKSLSLPLQYSFVFNPVYDTTNYIYSIYLAKDYLNDDIVMMHGDLVFDLDILHDMLKEENSYMAVSSTTPLPHKDFKAVIRDKMIEKIGVEFFDNAVAAQPLYKINREDWLIWLNHISMFCENGKVSCYAEKAFNEVSDTCNIYPMDYKNRLCAEIDTPEDLQLVKGLINDK